MDNYINKFFIYIIFCINYDMSYWLSYKSINIIIIFLLPTYYTQKFRIKKETLNKALNLNGGNANDMTNKSKTRLMSCSLAIDVPPLFAFSSLSSKANRLRTWLTRATREIGASSLYHSKLKSGRKIHRFLIRERRGSNSRPNYFIVIHNLTLY